jgi:hypothetical protein
MVSQLTSKLSFHITNYGKFPTDDGETLSLTENMRHAPEAHSALLRRIRCLMTDLITKEKLQEEVYLLVVAVTERGADAGSLHYFALTDLTAAEFTVFDRLNDKCAAGECWHGYGDLPDKNHPFHDMFVDAKLLGTDMSSDSEVSSKFPQPPRPLKYTIIGHPNDILPQQRIIRCSFFGLSN